MITGKTLRDAIISGANNIANQRTRVDELNVFPVPDGDTGTNMSMTIGAALSELNAMPDTCTVAEASKSAASAMLRGARGNSGVITSLLFRGFSKALAGKTDAEAADLAKALQMGVEAAYKAVMKPTEGTILTVTRLAAEAAVAAETDDVPQLWATVCEAGQKALEDTPNLLPVLKKAGVVDAGGQGIMLVFEGMKQVFDGGEIVAGAEVAAKPKLDSSAAGKGVFADDLMKVEDIKNGYCTQFLVHKDPGASITRLRAFLESNGELLRRMAASGHAVGILAESGEDTAEQLRRGNEALYRATLGKSRLAYVPDAEKTELQALEEVGWRCLTPSMDRSDYKLESSSNASALMKRVSARRGDVSAWLGTTASAAGLREFVISAQGAGHYCRAMTEIG